MLELISREGLNEALKAKEDKIYFLSPEDYNTLKEKGKIYDKDGNLIIFNEENYYAIEQEDNQEENIIIEIDNSLSNTSTNPVQNRVITNKIINIEEEIEKLFQSVSNGKKLIASAITDKGVYTPMDATFIIMAENIGKIKSGYDSIIKLEVVNNHKPLISNSCDMKNVANSHNIVIEIKKD